MELIPPAKARQVVRTASEVATDLIRGSILDGAVAPGTRLKEDDLATQLGLSRTPARRAPVVLEHEGLVRSERAAARYSASTTRSRSRNSIASVRGSRVWLRIEQPRE